MRLNKKAMMDDWMDLMFTIVMGLLIFFLVFSFTSSQKEAEDTNIQKDIDSIDYGTLLLHYVKSYTNFSYVNESNMTADLISEEYTKKQYHIPNTLVDQQANKFFTTDNNLYCWSLRLSAQDEIIKTISAYCPQGEVVKRVADLFIPVKGNATENIKLELFMRR